MPNPINLALERLDGPVLQKEPPPLELKDYLQQLEMKIEEL